jgi:predicted nucleotidyltransferase
MIDLEREKLSRLCRKYRVRRLWAFGSVLRDDFDPERSDLDLAVEFDPPDGMSLADQYFDLLEDLRHVLGRPDD